MRRLMALALIFVTLLGPLTPVVRAQTEANDRASALSVPLLKIPGRLTVDFLDDPKALSDYAGEVVRDPKTYLKAASALAASTLTVWLAHALPGPAIVRTALGLSGAFLGWELGKLDLKSINWVSQGAEIMAASGAYMLASKMMGITGIMAGGWAAGAAAVGAAILAHYLVHKLMPSHEAADGSHGATLAEGEHAEATVDAHTDAAVAATRPSESLDQAWAQWRTDMQTFRDQPSQVSLDAVRSSEQALRILQESARTSP